MDFIGRDFQSALKVQTVVPAIAFLLIALFVRSYFSSKARYYRKSPWVGLQNRFFRKLRARFNSVTSTRSMLEEGYQQYNAKNQAFALPTLGDGQMMVVPGRSVQNLSHQPEAVLSFMKVGAESLATKYTGDEDLDQNSFHFELVRKQLTRKLPLLTTDVSNELSLAMQQHWPAKKDEWTTVPAYRSCIKIVSRAANRVFCGKDLCRNDDFLEAILVYTQGVFANGFLINMLLPAWLRPLLGYLITYPNERPLNKAVKIATPVIEARLADLQKRKPADNSQHSDPVDALQWLIEEAIAQNDPSELNVRKLCRRIIRLNMVAIHTTSLSILGTLLDILESPHAEEIIAGIRDECSTVLRKYDGKWDKNAVNELYRVDSCLKESMRHSGLGLIGMIREVVAEDGADLGDGIHVPKGVKIAVAQRAIHNDPAFYERPLEYDAFRFSRARETQSANEAPGADMKTVLDQKNQAVITTSERFLGFGHGKHACPGRFFASQEMKLMLAQVFMNYDVRIKTPRVTRDLSVQTLPDDNAEFEVRLRS